MAEPTRIGAWTIVREIASGGFGSVYEVRRDGERGALKVLHAEHAAAAPVVARFLREAKVLGLLQHPSIVRAIDMGVAADGRPFLCMEYLTGESLAARLERDGPLEVGEAMRVLAAVCEALAAAHARGVIHRDVKASNIVVGDGRVVLVDFGIARSAAEAGAPLTATNQLVGTPMAMAPEQIDGRRPDERTDVYALGALLFHLLTGRPPFQDPSVTMTLYLHQHARRPRPSTVVPVSPDFDAVIARAMAITPEARFPDPLALLAAARAAAQARPGSAERLTVDAVAILLEVAEPSDVAALAPAALDDREAVIPRATRYMRARGMPLVIDLGSSVVYAAAATLAGDPAALARELHAHLDARPDRDPHTQLRVCARCTPAPFVGTELEPCSLLRIAEWARPPELTGAWLVAGDPDDDRPPTRLA